MWCCSRERGIGVYFLKNTHLLRKLGNLAFYLGSEWDNVPGRGDWEWKRHLWSAAGSFFIFTLSQAYIYLHCPCAGVVYKEVEKLSQLSWLEKHLSLIRSPNPLGESKLVPAYCFSVCVHLGAHFQACVCACGGQRSLGGIFFNHSSHYLLCICFIWVCVWYKCVCVCMSIRYVSA